MVQNTSDAAFTDWWLNNPKRFGKTDRRCFDTLVILTIWTISKERNRPTFDHVASSVDETARLVIKDVLVWLQAGFRTLEPFVANCELMPARLLGRSNVPL